MLLYLRGASTDLYQLFAIGLVTAMMGMVYWQDPVNQGNMPNDAATLIKVAPNVGTVFGMIVFGYLADLVGRKKMYGIELMIIITATLAESLCSASPGVSVVGVIVFWRVIMGIGIGGDYPLSAVITSEMADTKWRGAMIGAVFAMQGFGQFASGLPSKATLFYNALTLHSHDGPHCYSRLQRNLTCSKDSRKLRCSVPKGCGHNVAAGSWIWWYSRMVCTLLQIDDSRNPPIHF